MVCLDDFVYAVGGRGEETRLDTVERYVSSLIGNIQYVILIQIFWVPNI